MKERLIMQQFDELLNNYINSANSLYEEYLKDKDTDKYNTSDIELGEKFIEK